MLRHALLAIATLSLLFGLWVSWDHFQGGIDRDTFLARLYWVTAIWFVCATAWAYVGKSETGSSG